MVKYCPVCKGEFEDEILICSKDKLALLKRPVIDKVTKFLSIYSAKDQVELERIVGILSEVGIKAEEFTEGISQLPMPSETRFIVAVAENSRKMAQEKIRQAIADGIISDDGSFLN